ncbi:dipeptide/oligopeptide/nickel ABC transporter permease/ATP-binding protein [Microbacterium marmarense]|uniref:Dipeptide/oligopeptide/nickel ABC transporter permease/ATP-binding protein n=1 Tax=Microbacterium marmarense TaxID=3122051 RepID=A0ABU8LT92_9MICO
MTDSTSSVVGPYTQVLPVIPKRQSTFVRLIKNPLAAVGLFIVAIAVFVAVFAPWLAPYDPNFANVNDSFAPPFSPEHLLGADQSGRDILSRLLYGARTSLVGAAIAVGVAILVGVPSGLIAGYYQGWFDTVATWFANMFMSMPGIVIVLAVTAVLGESVEVTMGVFGILISPGVFRLTRTGVLSARKELYVDAAKVSGLSDARIIFRHVLSNVRAPLIIMGSMMIGIGIVLQAGLAFIGIGDASVPNWGAMLNDGFIVIYSQPIQLLWPGLAIGLTVVAFAFLGTALRDTVSHGDGPKAARVKTGKEQEAEEERMKREILPPEVELSPSASEDVPPVDVLLSVKNLRVGYPQAGGATKVVVDSVNLHVKKGEVLGLVGESGSGKSQTAFSVLGLLPAGGRVLSGSIAIDGESLTANPTRVASLRGARIGYIPQEPMSNLDPSFTLGYQLVEPIRKHMGLSKEAAKARVLELLDRVGIVDPPRTFDAYPHEVSGGMAQRILIAGAISCNPALLIADEPTTALDVTVQAEVLDLLRSLQTDYDMGVIMVTHNFGVVADICDRVAVMQHGRIVEQGDAAEIFTNPQNPYTQMLLGSTLEGGPSRAEQEESRSQS